MALKLLQYRLMWLYVRARIASSHFGVLSGVWNLVWIPYRGKRRPPV